MLTPNRFQHRSDGTTIIFLRYHDKVKRCVIWTRDYPRVRNYRWIAVWMPHVQTWYTASNGGVLMHRLLLPDCENVDHKNFDGLDNRIWQQKRGVGNIRPSTAVENARNRRKWLRKTSSRYKGVTWHKGMQQWTARIQVDGHKRIWLGGFEKEVQAGRAYDNAARDHFGEFALLNMGKRNCRRRRTA